MIRKFFVIGALGCLGFASSTRAAVIYSYLAQPQGGTITPGASNTLNLFLEETLTGSSSSFIASDGGLYAAGVAIVERAGGTGVTATAATVNTLASPAGFDPAGNNSSGLATGGVGAYVIGITDNNDTVGNAPFSTTTVAGTTNKLFLLGTVTLNVASNANAVFNVEALHDAPTNIAIKNAGTTGNTLTFNNFYDLDKGGLNGGVTTAGADGNPTPFTISTAAPEPGSLMLCGVAAAALAFRRRRAQKA